MISQRAFLSSIIAIVAVTIAVHVIGLSAQWMWGSHFYAFYPGGVVWAAVILLALGCAVVVRRRDAVAAWCSRRAAAMTGRRLWLAVAVVVALGSAVFWFARSTHTYLGDGNVLVISLPAGQSFHERQPLTMLLQQAIYRATKGFFDEGGGSIEDVAQSAAALGSVLAGVLFLIVSWFLSRETARLGRASGNKKPEGEGAALIIWFIVLLQGYAQLFFGYVENYGFFTVGIALYLWSALRYLRGAAPLVLPGLALLLALALHLSAVVLAPSFVALLVWGLARSGRRTKVLFDAAIIAAGFVGLHVVLGTVADGYSLTGTLKEVTGLAVTRRHEGLEGYMFSRMHYRDFINEQLLIGPLGLWLFLPAGVMAMATRLRARPPTVFFVIAGGTYLAASWIAGDSNLGYARNWDLLAPGGLVFTMAALGLFLMAGGLRAAWAALVCAVMVSLFHTVPWIATNASAERSLARLETLPLDRGRKEVLVAQWYRRADDEANQLRWLEKAVEVNPYNNNAQYLLALYHFERNNFEMAVRGFDNAAQLRPDKALFRRYLVQALFRLGRLPEAIPHLEFLIEDEPNQINNRILYAEALKKADRPDDARRAFEETEPIYRQMLKADPEGYATNLGYGWMLFNLKRYEDALPYFQKSYALNPESSDAVCYIGHTLRHLGRVDEAMKNFSRCLQMKPGHADRAEIENWATSIGRTLGEKE